MLVIVQDLCPKVLRNLPVDRAAIASFQQDITTEIEEIKSVACHERHGALYYLGTSCSGQQKLNSHDVGDLTIQITVSIAAKASSLLHDAERTVKVLLSFQQKLGLP